MQLRPKRPRSRAAVLSLTIPVALVALSAAQAKGGELDPRFDGDGKAIVDFGGPDDPQDMALAADGKVVVVGGHPTEDPVIGGRNNLALARLNVDGTLDSSFGTAGKVVTDLGTASTPNAVAIQGDGKVVAAGYSRVAERITLAAPSDFAIARYSADGSLDPTFGSGGTTTLSFGEGMHARAEGLALGSDGTIAVAGWAKPTSTGGGFGGSDFAVARLTAAGAPDTGFDGDGRTLTDFGAAETAEDVAVTPDGKVVVVGWGEHALWRATGPMERWTRRSATPARC